MTDEYGEKSVKKKKICIGQKKKKIQVCEKAKND